MHKVFALGVAFTLLVGCAVEDAVPEPADPRVRVDVEEMNVSFLFKEPLSLRASQDEAILTGETTAMQVQTQPYGDAKSGNAKDEVVTWSIPKEVAVAVRDGRTCEPLKTAKAMLPIDSAFPIRCDMIIDTAGRSVVWMVGIGRPFHDVAFMQSAFLVLEDERYHLFSYVYPFPESDATVQWLHESFAERHPNMSTLLWPNKSFLLLMDEVHESLSQQIEPSSPEVDAVMGELRDLSFSVGPSLESQGQ